MDSKELFEVEEPLRRLVSPVKSQRGEQLKYVKIKKLYAPDVAKMSQTLERVDKDATDIYKFYIILKTICIAGIVSFHESEDSPRVSGKSVLIGQLDPASALDLAIAISIITRGHPFVASSYKCDDTECGKYSIFDLDRKASRGTSEEYRDFQVDFFSYYAVDYNEEGVESYVFKFKNPYKIVSDKGKELVIKKLDTVFPPLSDYLSYSKQDGAGVGQMSALFNNIIGINDLKPAETKSNLKLFGRDSIMRMPPSDYKDYIDASTEDFRFRTDFSFFCLHCGKKNRDRFLDPSNLFDYLKP